MKMPVLMVAIIFATAVAHASPPCQAAIDNFAKTLVAARAMSDLDKKAKCTAFLKLITLQSQVGLVCTAPEDLKIVQETYLPLAKSAGDEATKNCPK